MIQRDRGGVKRTERVIQLGKSSSCAISSIIVRPLPGDFFKLSTQRAFKK